MDSPIYVRFFCGKCVDYYVLSSSKNCNPLIVVRQDLCDRVSKLTSVFLCVCPVIDEKLSHNIVKMAVQ